MKDYKTGRGFEPVGLLAGQLQTWITGRVVLGFREAGLDNNSGSGNGKLYALSAAALIVGGLGTSLLVSLGAQHSKE